MTGPNIALVMVVGCPGLAAGLGADRPSRGHEIRTSHLTAAQSTMAICPELHAAGQ